MVPRASRNVREGWPLGKAARATRAVSSGTGAMTCGWSDMTDILWLRGYRHDRHDGLHYAITHSPGAPLGRGSALDLFFTTKIFSVVNCRKKPLVRPLPQA